MISRSFIGLALAAATVAAPLVGVAKPNPATATIPTPQPSPVAPSAPPVASGYRAPDVRPTGGDIVGVTQQPFVGLALSDAIGMALSRNPNLSVAAADTRIASYQIVAARGAYDVNFKVTPSVSHSENAPQNAFFSGPDFSPIVQNTQTLEGGVAGILPSGAQYNVSLQQQKIDNNTAIDAFNPYYLASLNVAVTQPLLKGAGIGSEAQRQLRLATIDKTAVDAQTLATVSMTISQTEDAYWDLVAAWRNVAIQEDALHAAILQQASNVRLAKQGASAPIEAVESSTQVATYQDNVFSALQTVSELQNQLKSLMLGDPGDPIWQANLVPTSPVLQLPPDPSLADVLTTAMKNRPELQSVIAQQEQADTNLAYAKNQTLPQVDLQLNYQGNGFAGNALPPLGGAFGTATPPPYLDGQYGQAYGNIGHFPTYTAGVVISKPIGDHTAKANLDIAKENERIVKYSGANVDQRILFDVRNAVQSYQSALARLYAARTARQAAQQVYASEQRKFKNGASTTFLVLQRQVELVADEGRELQAQTDLNKAIVELQRADGSIISANNVSIDRLGAPDSDPMK